ncbi:hypothetical protein EIN_059840 [Entamoeba invadens IP1]|uniref:hypothetical protein n=1 Tax=Entamoeba invadens IP1 TaxID=370355 RepID=UPI0002C3E714|nr:hypothetical protein EIN_059840 [Entamoeba invadens IP1]ELP93489.1 hypothetical protein EIN_059840 [Entamoeba invadens IP1]|eukprot:XP_004260260.1 hypothetical protein EIN_059840 [Entamoeba invadens IP1]
MPFNFLTCISVFSSLVIIFFTLTLFSSSTSQLRFTVEPYDNHVKYKYVAPIKNKACPNGIDVVWLWVNGSDPNFLDLLAKSGKKSGAGRYRDYNTLQYSLRSVYAYAPYIKNYYIVTLNQIPDFLNTSSFQFNEYTLRIVDHKEIFPNPKDLPVFNSNSLEVSLHNIKNLSSCFLYLNDDMLLGKKLDISHFCRKDGKLNVYHNTWNAPEADGMKRNLWHRSVGNSNKLINDKFHPQNKTIKHPYSSHHCYFFKTQILQEMEKSYQTQYNLTRKHKFRDGTDCAVPFMHAAYSVESNRGVYVKERNYYYGLVDNNKTNNLKIVNGVKKKKPQCICLNDGLDDKNVTAMDNAIERMTDWLKAIYPNPSPFEKYH